MDLFLKQCARLIDRDILNHEDFVMIFSSAITQARHDILDEEAYQYQTIRKYEQLQTQQQRSLTRTVTPLDEARDGLASSGRSTLSYNEHEILEILAKVRGNQNMGEHLVIERLKQVALNGNVANEQFI
jgi:hypothetical protein